MKRLILTLALCLGAVPAFAQVEETATPTEDEGLTQKEKPVVRHTVQKSLPGFQEVNFGESPQTVTRKLSKRYKYDGQSERKTPSFVGDFGGYRNCMIETWFVSGKLSTVRTVVASQDGKNTLDIFFEIEKTLKSKYGDCYDIGVFNSSGARVPMSSLRNGLKYEIMSGNIYLREVWQFKDGNLISLSTMSSLEPFDKNLFVGLVYVSKNFEKIREQQRLSDF